MKFNQRNVYISPSATIGKNVRIGDNTTIYDNVVIGNNTTICNDCVIGEPVSDYYNNPDAYENPKTSIGANSLVRSHTLIYAGTKIGEGFSCGHRVTIREFSSLGERNRVGSLSDLQGNCKFGDHVWLHSNVHICQHANVGNFVFIYPYTVLTNDAKPPSDDLTGPKVGDFTQIAVHCVLLPGVSVGRHCLVGANSVIGKDFDDYGLIIGSPAKQIKDVKELKHAESTKTLYPWPQRFERGMPWAGQDFDTWLANSKYAQ